MGTIKRNYDIKRTSHPVCNACIYHNGHSICGIETETVDRRWDTPACKHFVGKFEVFGGEENGNDKKHS